VLSAHANSSRGATYVLIEPGSFPGRRRRRR